jgi:4-carboxymuconolactone decarboxylase
VRTEERPRWLTVLGFEGERTDSRPADVILDGKWILMNKDEQFQAGLALRRIMFGPGGSDEQIDNATDLTAAMQEFVTRECFGGTWQREGLSTRERSLVTVGMLLALGRSHEIRIHMLGALANGASVEELREVVLQSVMYCGIPAGMEGLRTLVDIATETAK